MEALGIGDLHLTDDSSKGGLSNYIENADAYAMSEVSRCCDYAIKHSITNIIFYGDVCENPRMSYAAMIAFTDCIKKYKALKFYLILGNHDKLSRNSLEGHSMQIIQLMGLRNLRVITEDEVIRVDGADVKFCPWPSKRFDSSMLNIGHTEVLGSKSDSGRLMAGTELSKSKAITCMGHLHTNHRVRNTYFSGTLYQTNFGEQLPKFFHHIEWKSVDDHEITDVPFDPLYKLFNCVVESQSDVDALPRNKTHLIKLVVKDGADVVLPDLPNIVLTKAFKTQTELGMILTEDLLQGSELEIKTSDFFRKWIADQSVPQALKKRASRLRKEILNGQQH